MRMRGKSEGSQQLGYWNGDDRRLVLPSSSETGKWASEPRNVSTKDNKHIWPFVLLKVESDVQSCPSTDQLYLQMPCQVLQRKEIEPKGRKSNSMANKSMRRNATKGHSKVTGSYTNLDTSSRFPPLPAKSQIHSILQIYSHMAIFHIKAPGPKII